jgi:integrase
LSEISYDVVVHAIERRRNANHVIISYRLSWRVNNEVWKRTFRTAAQAESFRSELLSATRRGEAFSRTTGRPYSWTTQEVGMSWYAFTLAYTKAKWPYISPNHRRGIAEALTDATDAMIIRRSAAPPLDERRAALRWSYSTRIRDDAEPPAELVRVVDWLEANTVTMDAFGDRAKAAALAREMLARISKTKTGRTAAANTINRKRMVLNNAMEYAREIGALSQNPLKLVKWAKPRTLTTVDPRVVINAEQARRFLAAVETYSERGKRLKAFFALMYYAGLRPEEASELRRENLTNLPDQPDQWGEMQLTHSRPRSGSRWTDAGLPGERSPLKHRPEGDIRRVPIHPELVTLLREHLQLYVQDDPDSRVFVGKHGGPITDRIYLKVFHEARRNAFTPAEAASPLLAVPYSLRHAAVSTWLRTSGDAAQVAEWAGHSIAVLLKVYAKCVHGTEDETLARIWDATRG